MEIFNPNLVYGYTPVTPTVNEDITNQTSSDTWSDWTPELKDSFEKNLASILQTVDPLDDEFFQLVDPTDI